MMRLRVPVHMYCFVLIPVFIHLTQSAIRAQIRMDLFCPCMLVWAEQKQQYVITSSIPIILGATLSVGIFLLVGHLEGVTKSFYLAVTEQ